MRALLQRVRAARVEVGERVIGEICYGFLLFICGVKDDSKAEAEMLARKIAKLRILRDEQGKMNRSILDVGSKALVVSQFTLAADLSRSNWPVFSCAAAPDAGSELHERFCRLLSDQGISVKTSKFGAEMAVSMANDSPVTIWIDSQDWAKCE